jgi:ribosomal protein S18 acetylase RimI-like enzyme
MENIAIRPAKPAHRCGVVECVDAAYFKYVDRLGGVRPAPMRVDYTALIAEGSVYVAAHEGEVCGVLVLKYAERHVLIENVAVHPDYQGRGLGQKLMRSAEQRAGEAGLKEVWLYTNELMTENIAFYRWLGYEEVERRSGEHYRRVYMRKQIAP